MKTLVSWAAVFALSLMLVSAREKAPEAEVRTVVEQFEQGLAQHDLTRIEPLMAADMVAFENGQRNDGWQDFRDNHLVPEMKEPAPPSHTEVIRVVVTPQMGWAYTRADLTLTRKGGEKVEARLWTVYVLEKRGEQWKIVVLDWSFYVPRPTQSK